MHTTPDVKTSPSPSTKDLSAWIDRIAASDLLGVAMSTLFNWEREDKLHPQKHRRQTRDNQMRWIWVYDPHELAKMPRRSRAEVRTRGEVTALAFDLFRQGAALDAVAIELREDPDTVMHLHERWLDMSRARYVITPELWNDFEEIVGKFADVTTLLVRMKEIAAKAQQQATAVDQIASTDVVANANEETVARGVLTHSDLPYPPDVR